MRRVLYKAFLGPRGSMRDYLVAAARSREHVGFYSYYVWCALVAPECHHTHCMEDDARLGNHTARFEA